MEDEMNKEKLIEVLKTIMMLFIGIGILALMMWIVTLALVATGS
jgi:predicted nucleic acid-binding Zn ribbon protein